MKSIILAFCIWFITVIAQAQAPDYFANNPEWLQSSSCRIYTDCIETINFVYYIKGDTTIGNSEYKKLFVRGNRKKLFWGGNPPPNNTCYGSENFDLQGSLIRQENNKVFIYYGSEDVLLYDFDLVVGDTLPITHNQRDSDAVVTGIDSILIGNEYRKIFYLNASGSLWATYLIEGIGSDKGLLQPMNVVFDCGYGLACFALNDSVYYPSPLSFTCDFTVDVDRKSEKAQIKIFPNPVKDQIKIEGLNLASLPVEILLFDYTGKMVLKEIINSETKVLKLGHLKPGIYFLMANLGEDKVFKKIVKTE